jgi:hypothetical protein
MKIKIVFQAFLIGLVLPMLLTGCFTKYYSEGVIQGSSDWFSAKSLYKSSNGNIAIGGTLSHEGKTTDAYLVVPKEVLLKAQANTQTNQVSLSEIRTLPPEEQKKLFVITKLSPDYEKIANFPKGQGGMDVNQRHTVNISAVGALPFAFVVDVVTFPLQVWISNHPKGEPIN